MNEPGSSRVFLGVGSNIDPHQNVHRGVEMVAAAEGITLEGISTFYRTAPLSPPGSPDPTAHRSDPEFLNGVLEIRTRLDLGELEEFLSTIEVELGRTRTQDKYAPRTMDMDVLLYLPLEGPGTPPPHPDLLTRAWVALPLLELAPDLLLPPDGRPLAEVATAFDDGGGAPENGITADLRLRFLPGKSV